MQSELCYISAGLPVCSCRVLLFSLSSKMQSYFAKCRTLEVPGINRFTTRPAHYCQIVMLLMAISILSVYVQSRIRVVAKERCVAPFTQYFAAMRGDISLYKYTVYPSSADIQMAIKKHQTQDCRSARFLVFTLYAWFFIKCSALFYLICLILIRNLLSKDSLADRVQGMRTHRTFIIKLSACVAFPFCTFSCVKQMEQWIRLRYFWRIYRAFNGDREWASTAASLTIEWMGTCTWMQHDNTVMLLFTRERMQTIRN